MEISARHISAVVVYCTLLVLLQKFIDRSMSVHFLFTISLIVVIYLYLIRIGGNYSMKSIILVALLLRLVCIPFFPTLSDDIYRYFWDGMLLSNGYNPYELVPSAWMQAHPGHELAAAYHSLNSPHYHAVYPPGAQYLFAGVAWVAHGDIRQFNILMKVLYIILDMYAIINLSKILTRLKFDKKSVIIYALSPLIILEGIANLHLELPMVVLTIVALRYLMRQQVFLSAIAMAGAVIMKMTIGLILPLLWLKRSGRRSVMYTVPLVISILLFFWVHVGPVYNIISSLELYINRFEFNASIYYLIRYIGSLCLGYNPIAVIGPLLGVTFIGFSILLIWKYRRRTSWIELVQLFSIIWTIYLLLSTTVHPWYVLPIVALVPITRFSWPLVWSIVVFLSYAAYGHNPVQESWLIIGFEYLMVIPLFIYEVLRWMKIEQRNTTGLKYLNF